MIDQELFILPNKIIECGNLIFIYDTYVIKYYIHPKQMFHSFPKRLMIENEINFLKQCKNNKYIIQVLYFDLNNRFIVLEKADCNIHKAVISKLITKKFVYNFIDKLKINFKKEQIIHRDLSARNMVYFKDTNTIKIIDFGISSIKTNDVSKIYNKHRKTIDNFDKLKLRIKSIHE